MRYGTVCIMALLSFLSIGECKMLLASEATGPLVLSATTVGLDGKSRNEFAAKEPIWVRLSLENTGGNKVTVWLNGMGEYGIQ
ncbi:unnamed protein product, partial [marine sediment metagenome]